MAEPAGGGPLEQLLVVQQHDTSADQIRHRRAHLPEREELGVVERQLARLRGRREELAGGRARLAGEQGALEAEVEGLERRRRDLDRRLAAGTVPKELERLSAEIDGVAARIGVLEDRELELMEAMEPVDAELDELAREEAGVAERRAALRSAVKDAEAALDAELAHQADARAAAVAAVPPDLLTRYDGLRRRLGGVAVARLVAGRCTGCNLQLPTSEVERVRHEDAAAMVTCEQCGRLLVR